MSKNKQYLQLNNNLNCDIFSDIEIRKNRKLIDYLEVIFKPKMYKKYLLITENNFPTINEEELHNLFNSLVISMPVKFTGKN